MTVRLNSNTQHFIGDAADIKPTGIDVGSLFTERDTGNIYTTYDGTNWVIYITHGEDLYRDDRVKG